MRLAASREMVARNFRKIEEKTYQISARKENRPLENVDDIDTEILSVVTQEIHLL